MSKKLSLVGFIKPSVLDEIIFESDIWDNADDIRLDTRTKNLQYKQNKPVNAESGLFNKFVRRFGNNANVINVEQSELIKDALADFIIKELPNIRISSSRYSLGDLTAKSGNLTDVIRKTEVKPWFYTLCSKVNSWLEQEKKSGKEAEITQLLTPFHGRISDFVYSAIAPLVTAKIQAKNGTK